jgi:hypothetical protein
MVTFLRSKSVFFRVGAEGGNIVDAMLKPKRKAFVGFARITGDFRKQSAII